MKRGMEMPSSNKSERPRRVQEARARGDIPSLKAMGRKGAEVTNRKKAARRREDEMLAALIAEDREREQLKRDMEANYDIIPPNSED